MRARGKGSRRRRRVSGIIKFEIQYNQPIAVNNVMNRLPYRDGNDDAGTLSVATSDSYDKDI